MIGDRWDDAMDDLSADETKLDNEIRELKKNLKSQDLTIPPYVPSVVSSESGPDVMYTDYQRELRVLESYRDELLGIWVRFQTKTRMFWAGAAACGKTHRGKRHAIFH